MAKSRTHLLVIDAQNDFCDLPESWLPPDPPAAGGAGSNASHDASDNTDTGIGDPGNAGMARLAPSLPVAGAHADLLRLAGFIDRAGDALADLTLTFDSHHRYGIERPAFWRQADGDAVAPFTPITAQVVREGRFAPRAEGAAARVLAYLDALEAAGRYTLMVWPAHCEIGSWGHGLHAAVGRACAAWEARSLRAARKVMKGTNPLTEHYSAIRAEVPDAADPSTQTNEALLAALAEADTLLVAGQAGSHCVRATVQDVADHFLRRLGRADLSNLVLLTDCMSPVAGFEANQQAFLDEMRALGARLVTAGEALAARPAQAPR